MTKCGQFLTMAEGSTRGLKRYLEDVHDFKIDEAKGKKQKTDGGSGSDLDNGGMDNFLTEKQDGWILMKSWPGRLQSMS